MAQQSFNSLIRDMGTHTVEQIIDAADLWKFQFPNTGHGDSYMDFDFYINKSGDSFNSLIRDMGTHTGGNLDGKRRDS